MRKTFKSIARRALCIVLTVMMFVSIISICAFADSKEIKHYNYYTVLGDSIAAAYGLKAYEEMVPRGQLVNDGVRVPGSYADTVAYAVGAKTVDMRAHTGWRTVEYLDILDYPGFNYNDTYNKNYNDSFYFTALNFFEKQAMQGEKERIIKSLKNADLITLNIGANDVFSFAEAVIVSKYFFVISDFQLKSIKTPEDLTEAFGKLLSSVDTELIKGIVAEYMDALTKGFAMYKYYFPMLIDAINDYKKPTADLYVIGMSNPISINFPIDFNRLGIDFYTFVDFITDQMNYFTHYKCPCADQYTYVDVTGTSYYGIAGFDVSTALTLDLQGMMLSAFKMVHPDEAGHSYMAQKIIATLKEELPFKDVSKSNASYDAIRYVYYKDIMHGATNTLFAPDLILTRAQMSELFYRIGGGNSYGTEPFLDVPDSHWAHDAIAWAYRQGVINGVTGTYFMPGNPITRAQAVSMFYRYAKASTNSDSYKQFKDWRLISASNRDAVSWALDNGVIDLGNGFFNQNGLVTRAQAAVMINNYFNSGK